MFTHIRALLAAAALVFAAVIPAAAMAQSSDRPIRLIVPLPPGGPVDAVARELAALIGRNAKQTVFVENVAGAYGAIGLGRLSRSAPDGTTIAIAASGMLVLAPLIDPAVPYNPSKDFAPIGTVTEYANVLVVNPSLPVKTVQELIAYSKANPSAITYASSGKGSSNHLAGELLKMKAGASLLHVPYKGTAPGLMDVMAGHASMMFDVISSSAPYIESGKLRALASTGKQRSTVLKDVPTLGETIPGFEVTGWFALVAPPGISPEVAKRLNDLIAPVVATQEFKQFLVRNGFDSTKFSPQDLAARINDDVAVWAPVVKAAGFGKKAD